MAQFSRTWWGRRFIEALEQFTDPARLGRGRSYASGGRIISYKVENGTVTAKVRGSINPYYGVYKEPTYTTSITLLPISRANWSKVIASLASKAGFVARLLMSEMPDNVEEVFAEMNLHLLPGSRRDFATSCSCPDDANPCKHIAGVYYLLAAALDQDPFLLFELRGLPRDQLHDELAKSPLGRILSSELAEGDVALVPDDTYYTRPTREAADAPGSLKEFWTGARRLPTLVETAEPPGVTALLIKKQGDYPPFWRKDASFIGVMEELYERVRTKNSQIK